MHFVILLVYVYNPYLDQLYAYHHIKNQPTVLGTKNISKTKVLLPGPTAE